MSESLAQGRGQEWVQHGLEEAVLELGQADGDLGQGGGRGDGKKWKDWIDISRIKFESIM